MLKGQGLRVLRLNEKGDAVIKEEILLEKLFGRIRDICVSPAGDVYISTSNHDWNPMTTPAERDDRILRIAKVDAAVKAPIKAKTKEQSYVNVSTGETIYQQYCFSCHKEKGEGLENIYPALVGSSVVKNQRRLVETVLNGVQGSEYVMPSFSFLDDEALSKVLTYVHHSFGKGEEDIDPHLLQQVRATSKYIE